MWWLFPFYNIKNKKKGGGRTKEMPKKNDSRKTLKDCFATEWLEEDNLMLISCWARDGYTYADIANRIGISMSTLREWRVKYPEINNALKKGREIIDYKVENALLKSALGYKTKEVKITTVIQSGEVVETTKEVTEKEQAPNVYACQCWLYNRLPKKWKNMNSRANIFEDIEEDTSLQITVTRANTKDNEETKESKSKTDDTVDLEWKDEINESIEIRKATKEEIKEKQKKAKEKANNKKEDKSNMKTKISFDESDLDDWSEWDGEE